MDHGDDEAVRARAYQLWEEGGRAHGQHEAHWRQAEQDVGAADAPPTMPGDGGAAEPHVDGVSPLPAQDQDDVPPRV